MSAVAAVTREIRLGTSILNIAVRNPLVCAKALSAIDILSSGRLFAGVGPGSHKGDYDVCGIPFEERWGRLIEALQVLRILWTSPVAEFSGKFYKLDKVVLDPKPYRKPNPPIILGSWGSELSLRRVASYSDGWMASAYNITPEGFKEKWKLLLAYRRDLGKNVESFENSVMTMFGYVTTNEEKAHKPVSDVLSPSLRRPPDVFQKLLLFGSPEECVRKLRRFVDAGAKRIHFWPISDYFEQIEILSNEVTPQFQ